MYHGEDVTGAVVREHDMHTHKGIEGKIVEVRGGKYAWVKLAADRSGAPPG